MRGYNSLSTKFISEWGGVGERILSTVSSYLRGCEMFYIVGGVNIKSRRAVRVLYEGVKIERPLIYFKNKYIRTEKGENILNVYSKKWSVHNDSESLLYAVIKKNILKIRDIVDGSWGWRCLSRKEVWERGEIVRSVKAN